MAKISKTYKPTQKEKFMNAKMKEYFRQKLESWKNELLKESSQTLNNLQTCLLDTSPSPRDKRQSRMPSSA